MHLVRRLTRFSLGTLLLVLVVVAGLFSAHRAVVLPVQRRVEARTVVAEGGLAVETRPGSAWPWTLAFTEDELARPVAVRRPPSRKVAATLNGWLPAGRTVLDWEDDVWAYRAPTAAAPGGEPALGPKVWASLGRLTDLTVLDLRHLPAWPPEAGQAVARLSNLEELDVTGVPLRDEDVAVFLPHLTRLKRLHLGDTRLTGHALASLANCRELEDLVLPETIAFDELPLLPELPRLRTLVPGDGPGGRDRLGATDVAALRHLAASPLTAFSRAVPLNLLRADAHGGLRPPQSVATPPTHVTVAATLPRLPDDAASRAVVGEFSHLTSLDLTANTLRADDLAWLSRLTKLETLVIGRSELAADDWRTIAALPALKNLSVSPSSWGLGALTFPSEETLAGLKHLRRLESLSLVLPATRPEDLPAYPDLLVRNVSLSFPLTSSPVVPMIDSWRPKWLLGNLSVELGLPSAKPVTVRAEDLPRLDVSQVKTLTIQGLPSAADVAKLATLKRLRELRIHAADEPIPADVVAAVARHPGLEKVTLWSRTRIDGLAALASPARLTSVEVFTPEIAAADLKAFTTSKARGNVSIQAQASPAAIADALAGVPEEHLWRREGQITFRLVRPDGRLGVTLQAWYLPRYADVHGWFPGASEEAMFLLPGTGSAFDRGTLAWLAEASPQTTIGLPVRHITDDLADAVAAHPVETLAVSLTGDRPDADADEDLRRVFALAGRLPRLTTLRVASPAGTVTGPDVGRLASLAGLSVLDLEHARTDAGGRAAIGRLKALTELTLTPAERTVPRPREHDGAFLTTLPALATVRAPRLRLTTEAVAAIRAVRPDVRLTVSPVRLDAATAAALAGP